MFLYYFAPSEILLNEGKYNYKYSLMCKKYKIKHLNLVKITFSL